ncbi:unnamed protein product, partial [marine sediment metagenome]
IVIIKKNATDKLKASNMTCLKNCFHSCSGLIAIPNGLFDNNIAVINFSACFANCTSLTAIPNGLFDYNILVNDFSFCFYNCSSLMSIPVGLFDNNTDVNTFQSCFGKGQNLTGLAPELWLREPEPNGSKCFYNATGLDNYDDIPDDWKIS